MRLIFNILAIVGLVIGLTSTAQLYLLRMGDAASQGFANVTVPLWALTGAGAALLFGFLGRMMDRRAPRPVAKISNVAILLGSLCGALTLAVPFVFG